MLEYAFMQRALAAAVVAGVVCGALGFFVVLRRLAFIGVGISHAAIGGVALGLILGLDPVWVGGGFALAVALGIAAVGRRSALSRDAVIGVFFSGAMAFGIVVASLRRGAQEQLFGYLFGDILALTPRDLVGLSALGLLVLAALAITFRQQLFVAFDEEIARAYGHPVDALEVLLLLLLAATVVVGVRLVGVLLMEALLVVPAATAALVAPRYRAQLVLSMALAAGSGIAGLALAWQLDVAAGGCIALVAVAAFFATLALAPRRG